MYSCEHCGVPFTALFNTTKRFCSERCRKNAETKRRKARRRAERPPALPRERRLATACKDCGTTEGMGWWLGRMKHPGAARARCHSCYLAYTRRRQSGDRAGTRPRLTPEEREARQPGRACIACGEWFVRRGTGVRCTTCALAYRAEYKSESAARRRAAELEGDNIHWSSLGERDGWTCHLCGGAVQHEAGGAKRPKGATVDHLVPIADGGKHLWENVALAHRRCNLSRGTRGLTQLRLVG